MISSPPVQRRVDLRDGRLVVDQALQVGVLQPAADLRRKNWNCSWRRMSTPNFMEWLPLQQGEGILDLVVVQGGELRQVDGQTDAGAGGGGVEAVQARDRESRWTECARPRRDSAALVLV